MHTGMHTIVDLGATLLSSSQKWPQPERVEPGTVLFEEGGVASEVFWIMDGIVKVVGGARQGRPATRGLRRGECLLAFTAPHTQQYRMTGIAVSTTRLHRFDAREFRERLGDPEFMRRAQAMMFRALRADLEDYTRGCLRHPEHRLAAALAIFVDDEGAWREGQQVVLPPGLGATDLADLLDVTSSQLTRLLASWRREGRLYQDRGRLGFTRLAFDGLTRESAHDVVEDARAATTRVGGPAWCPPPVASDARVARAIAMIGEEYAHAGFSLRDVSRQVNLSPWHLSRLLKRTTGLTFRQLVTRVRLEHARVALRTTTLSIKEIAARVGYNYLSDLTHRFTAVHRMSPTAYRMQACEAGGKGEAAATVAPAAGRPATHRVGRAI